MSLEQFNGLLRTLIGFGGGWAASRGYLSADQVTLLIGAASGVAAFGWSFIEKRNKA